MAVPDALFSKAVYLWYRNTNTPGVGASEEGSQQKNPTLFLSPQCPPLQVSLFLQTPQLDHSPGWQAPLFISFVTLSQPLLCLCVLSPGWVTLLCPLCYSKAQQFTSAQPLQLNLHFRPTTWARFIHFNTNLGCFVMPQSSRGAREVLVVPQTWHGNRVLPVLEWGLGMFR